MSCNTIFHTPGGDAPRSAGMWLGPLDILPQISIFRALFDPKKIPANSPGYHFKAKRLCWNQGCTNCGILASWLRENVERIRKREETREIHSLPFLIFSLFSLSLSISYIKNCHILWQSVKHGTFVANVTKNLTYPLWENKIILDECGTGHQESCRPGWNKKTCPNFSGTRKCLS